MTEGEQANGWQRGRRERRDLCSLVRGWATGGMEWRQERKSQVNIGETFLADLLDRWANLPNEASFSPRNSEWAYINVSWPFVSVTGDPKWYLAGRSIFLLKIVFKSQNPPFSLRDTGRLLRGMCLSRHNSRHSHLLSITKTYCLLYNF